MLLLFHTMLIKLFPSHSKEQQMVATKKVIKNIFISISSLSIVFSACNNGHKLKDHFPEKHLAKSQIAIQELKLDSLSLGGFNSSFTGQVQIDKDTIYFIDSRFGSVFLFNKEGKLEKTVLGQGPGPKEIDTKYIDGAYIDDQIKIFLGSSFDAHLYNSNWEKTKSFAINWKWKVNNIDKINDPEATERALYTFEWEKMIVKKYGDFLYVPIYSQHRNFNAFVSKRYFEEGPILAKINLKTGVVDELLGRRSPKYLDHDLLGQFSFFAFDINKAGDFLITHEIDPKIYVYDQSFKPLRSFGVPGLGMDTAYVDFKITGDPNQKNNMKSLQQRFNQDQLKYGFYKEIFNSPSTPYVFRSYEKGNNLINSGLQIYKDEVLVGDVLVPKNFKVIGYIAPFYYAYCGTNEAEDSIRIYRFSI